MKNTLVIILIFLLLCCKKEESREIEIFSLKVPKKVKIVTVRVFNEPLSDEIKKEIGEFVKKYLSLGESILENYMKSNNAENEYYKLENYQSEMFISFNVSPNHFSVYETYEVDSIELSDDQTILVRVKYNLIGKYDTREIGYSAQNSSHIESIWLRYENSRWQVVQVDGDFYYTKKALLGYLQSIGSNKHGIKYLKLFKELDKEWIPCKVSKCNQ